MKIYDVFAATVRVGAVDWGSDVRRRPSGETIALAAAPGGGFRLAREADGQHWIETKHWDRDDVSARRVIPHVAI